MRTTTDLNSEIFDRLRKGKNRLASPFSKKFTYEEWKQAHHECSGSTRDTNLLVCGLFVAEQVNSLRGTFFDGLFMGMSKRTAIRLAVASANLEYSLFQTQLRKLIDKKMERGEPMHIEQLREIEVLGAGISVSPDDYVTATVDSLPHWLFEAIELGQQRENQHFPFENVRRRCASILSVEHALKNVWDAALWEGYYLTKSHDTFRLQPSSKKDAFYWHACQLRYEADVMGRSIAIGNGDIVFDYDVELPTKTIRSVAIKGNRTFLRLGSRPKRSQDDLRACILTTAHSYLGPVIDEPIGADYGNITPLQLVLVLQIMKDAAQAFAKLGLPKSTQTYSHVRKLSFGLPRVSLIHAVQECLGVDQEVATHLIDCISIAPNESKKLFRDALWSRPLIAIDDVELLLVSPAIEAGSVHRFVELHLEEAMNKTPMASTSLGVKFEKSLRKRTQTAATSNALLNEFYICEHAISQQKGVPDSEEIDLLVRLGNKVIVGEVKAFVKPTEPIERYNHLRKLEDAAAQANRKADWFRNSLPDFVEQIGWKGGVEKLEVLPLVLINQTFGSGLRINNCLITDENLWILYLSAKSYNSSAVRYMGEQLDMHTTFYESETELVARLEKTLEDVPPLRPYLDAESWGTSPLPTAQGKRFEMLMPTLSASKMADEEMKQAGVMLEKFTL